MSGRYTSDIPAYELDLALPEGERWRHVIRAERSVARRLASQALEEAGALRDYLGPIGWVFEKVYSGFGGLYGDEIATWAKAMGVTSGEATLLNCTYELSHALRVPGVFGCTAGVRAVRGLGLVHVRSMDWDLSEIGNATRLFWFTKGRHRFVSVGVVGFVGVLSGMVPGAYSVTINWAPPLGRPTFAFGPAFLLREVLETCTTYDEAVYALQHTELSTPVFFTVCGAKKGQACVIERTQDDACVRKLTGEVLVQANHHVARRLRGNNAEMTEAEEGYVSMLEESSDRAATLERELSKVKAATDLADVARVLDVEPVWNSQSFQQMAFCPRTGEVVAWRWRS